MFVITAKMQILPADEEQSILLETMRAYSAACNFVSEYIFSTHDLKQSSLNNALYRPLRDKFALRSQMAQSVLKTVIARYRTILTNDKQWIKPDFKHPEYDLVWNRDYSVTSSHFSLNTLQGRVKLQYHKKGMEQYFDGTWSFGTAKLINKHGKWFLHIPVSKDITLCPDAEINNVVGCDLGVNFLATTYDSKGTSTFYSGKEIKHRRAQYSKLRKELQQRHTASARRRLKAIGSRENRWMQDVNHCISKALVQAASPKTLFALEDLTGVRGATERVRLKYRYVNVSWSFFDFRKKLEYKTHRCGSKVVVLDPKYTSQTCPKCGHTEKSNRNRKTHTFRCNNCDYTSNDDRIGAMNLHRKGIEYLSAVASE
jgi:IS605 OrfB family transposase